MDKYLTTFTLAALLLWVSPSLSLITPVPTGTSKLHLAVEPTKASTRIILDRQATVSGRASSASDGAMSSSSLNAGNDALAEKPLPRELMPITMGVFAQMLGEGIALSSLPLYLTRLGAAPTSVGMAISCFSLAQMTFAPILVSLSSRIGRSIVLRICLAGAVASSLLIAFSGSVWGVIAGRTLAGIFAACVPVAQSGVTDILSKDQTALGLSRVSAASQLGVVVGPAASAIFQELFAAVGIAPSKCLPAVFCLASVFTLSVLAQMTLMDRRSKAKAAVSNEQQPPQKRHNDAKSEEPKNAEEKETAPILRRAQPMLRTITIVIGWTAILSNSIYGLFAPKFLGFSQPQLSATYSVAAALMVTTQVIFPRLISKIGEHRVCTIGIVAAGVGIGGQSLVRFQPFHTLLYMINRSGAGIADTATAALVARSSGNRESRSRNLALLTSTRAAARIITPLLSSKMFELSCREGFSTIIRAGSLPFVTAACFAMAVAPLPSVLKRAEQRQERKKRKEH